MIFGVTSNGGSALVQLIAAIGVGSVVGAVLAAVFNHHFTARRERKASERALQGIARMLHEDFFRQQSTLARAIFRQSWWRSEELFAPLVSAQDILVLASRLTENQWAAVAKATGWMIYLEQVQVAATTGGSRAPASTPTLPPSTLDAHHVPPTDEQLERFDKLYRALDVARYALLEVANRRYVLHNSANMKRDVIAEASAAGVDTRGIEVRQLESLCELEVKRRLDRGV